MNRVPLYILNDFLKFDRKIYQVFGFRLGRPIRLKVVLYFFVLGIFELIWYFTPVLGIPLHWLPVSILVFLPGLLTYLLSGIGTEDRSPLAFFRSFFSYHIRKLKKVTYHKGGELKDPGMFSFHGHVTVRENQTGTEPLRSKVHRFQGYFTVRGF